MMNIFFSVMSKPLLNLPTPSFISYWWNMGSMLALVLSMQIFSGLFLTMNYCPSPSLAFLSISSIMHNFWMGWMIRYFHTTGASMMMLLLYFHIGRNIYFTNLKNFFTAMSGVGILLATMMTAFLGYVLPWGQMSFWGATVITSLASVVPFFGQSIVKWLWGNFAVSSTTLNRFFMLHFILPFTILLLSIIHLMTLHKFGSLSPLFYKKNIEMIEFHPKFSYKDIYPLLMLMILIMLLTISSPLIFLDPENYLIANPLTTPNHIQPEWYFLFSYAILRCIPNKIGGVIALICSIMVVLFPIFKNPLNFNNSFFFSKKLLFWLMMASLLILTWIGANPVSEPLINLALIFTFLFFLLFSLILFLSLLNNALKYKKNEKNS